MFHCVSALMKVFTHLLVFLFCFEIIYQNNLENVVLIKKMHKRSGNMQNVIISDLEN